MLELRLKRKCFEGDLCFYTHESKSCHGPMNFSIFLPNLGDRKLPVVFFLSGLTCNEENFMMKAGAQRVAAELGLIIVAPDTSPREQISRDTEGASYYVNATQEPFKQRYQMYDYISKELPDLIDVHFPTIVGKRSIMGHSMGGHGAMVIGIRNPEQFLAISAFAPICAPSKSVNGSIALQRFLGDDQKTWEQYDTVALLKKYKLVQQPILIDQGTKDDFLANLRIQDLLDLKLPQSQVQVRMQEDYDHSYYFVSSFIEEHLKFHFSKLGL